MIPCHGQSAGPVQPQLDKLVTTLEGAAQEGQPVVLE